MQGSPELDIGLTGLEFECCQLPVVNSDAYVKSFKCEPKASWEYGINMNRVSIPPGSTPIGLYIKVDNHFFKLKNLVRFKNIKKLFF